MQPIGVSEARTMDAGAIEAAGALPPTRTSFSGALPPNDRPRAALTVLDITKWFGHTSGGVKSYLQEKARFVTRREDLRHVLVLPGAHDSVRVGPGVRTYQLRGPRIPTQSAYRFLLATRSTRRIVLHERPDVIEVGSPFIVPWVTALAARRTGIPLVGFHHMMLTRPSSNAQWPGHGSRVAYLRQLNRLFRLTVAASQFSAAELRAAGVEHVEQVPLGVDLQLFHPSRRAERAAVRRRFGIPLDRPVGLFVGRLAPEKRLDVMLDAWGGAARSTDSVLVIVGDGAARPELQRRQRTPQVIWLPYQGNRETVANLMAAADVYVSAADAETFGLAALEAMASGTPVLSSHLGGVAELVARSGAGRLFAAGSPDSLARSWERLLSSDLTALSIRGRTFAEHEHAWDRVFERLFALYERVVHP